MVAVAFYYLRASAAAASRHVCAQLGGAASRCSHSRMAALDRAERRACFAQNKQRMQHSSLSCHAMGPAPPATSSRHRGRQMTPANPAQGTPQRLPLYNLGDHDASLEVHSQAIDGSRRDHVVDRRTSDAWKERLRKEQRVLDRALLAQAAADQPPNASSEQAAWPRH